MKILLFPPFFFIFRSTAHFINRLYHLGPSSIQILLLTCICHKTPLITMLFDEPQYMDKKKKNYIMGKIDPR